MKSAQTIERELHGRAFAASAPAKLNVILRITGRRADGFHLLDMFNVVLDFGDEIEFGVRPASEKRISVVIPDESPVVLPADFADPAHNLASRAAEIVLQELDIELGYHILIRKRVPLGTGMGGGSSDAAAVMRLALEVLAPYRGVDRSNVLTRAVQLGADVPFFLGGGAAIVGGIGEKISPMREHPLRGCRCAVLFPRVAVPTPEAYRLYRARYPVVPAPAEALSAALCQSDPRALLQNDLEGVVGQAFPELGRVLAAARAVPGCRAGMTGSGSAVFVLPENGLNLPAGALAELAKRAGCPIVEAVIQ